MNLDESYDQSYFREESLVPGCNTLVIASLTIIKVDEVLKIWGKKPKPIKMNKISFEMKNIAIRRLEKVKELGHHNFQKLEKKIIRLKHIEIARN